MVCIKEQIDSCLQVIHWPIPTTPSPPICIKHTHTHTILQFEVRMKTVAMTILQGRKKNWRFQDRWLGDELGKPEHNKSAASFEQVVSSVHGDSSTFHSPPVILSHTHCHTYTHTPYS